jgi:DNA polymerase elongation subunit (family B)
MYYDSDDPSVNHRELFLDIEVSTENGYASGEDAWQPLTSIAIHDKVGQRSIAIIVDSKRALKPYTDSNLILEVVQTEIELIQKFLTYYIEIRPTIITGWNIDRFDIPYLYNRILRVAGPSYANSLSPIGEVSYNNRINQYFIAGVSCLDYMRLYKTFTYSEEPSYSLDAICKKELGKGKIEYEGTLDHLYKTDPEKFVKYNINDVELVLELDDKLKFLDLARGICHKGHVPYEDVYFTTRYLDGACLTFMKRLGIVAPNRQKYDDLSEENSEDNDFAGAFVKVPKPGLYEWVFDEDMSSLYPSIIRTLNISPEKKVGRIENWDDIKDAFWKDSDLTVNAKIKKGSKFELVPVNSLRKWLLEHTYSISSIGVIYDAKATGLVPSILETWMNEREEYRALAKKYSKEGNKELSEFFNSRQLTTKIINNSLYGALGAAGFRFHDLDNAESITLTGREVIRNAMNKGNEWFINQTGVEEDYVIYVDTDSTFFSAMPIINLMESKLKMKLTDAQKSEITFKTSQTVEKYINDSWNHFAKHYLNSDIHYLSIKQEYVSETAFWIAKKRYAQKIISEKGVLISDITKGKQQWKLDVKGMDVVRSNFPKAFRELMSNILIDILNKENKSVIDEKIINFRDSLPSQALLDIMFPTGVKDVDKYVNKKVSLDVFGTRPKGTPIHVKSALNYNDLMRYYKITDSIGIVSGDKIKWTYLKQNPFGIDTCALKGFQDDDRIVQFILNNIDYDQIFESALENKLGDFYSAMNWGVIPKNNTLSDFFSF